MKRTALALVLMLTLFISLVMGVQSAKSSSKTIIVPDDYSTIQEAINAAVDGDTVFVKKGLYNETLVVNKTISLIGEDRNLTIIDAQKAWAQVILIQGTNITVANFTLGNNDFHPVLDSGWYQRDGEGDGVEIVGYDSSGINVINNTIIGCPISGIHPYAANNCTILGNIIVSSIYAIKIESVYNFISSNTFLNSTYGAFLYAHDINGINLNENNIIQNNNNITLADVPNPFPPISPSPIPSIEPTQSPEPQPEPFPTALGIAIAILVVIATLALVIVVCAKLLVYYKKQQPVSKDVKQNTT